MVYPRDDDFIELTKQKDQGCLLYRTDLRRPFRQLSYCLLRTTKWPLYGKHIFFGTVLCMGSRLPAYCCQIFTNGIAFILLEFGIAFKTLQAVLKKCGIEVLLSSQGQF